MKLVTEKPLEHFLDSVPQDTKTLIIVSPFISKPAMNKIYEMFKYKRSLKIKILTNLGQHNLIFTLNDPVEPLLYLKEKIETLKARKVEIKSNETCMRSFLWPTNDELLSVQVI